MPSRNERRGEQVTEENKFKEPWITAALLTNVPIVGRLE